MGPLTPRRRPLKASPRPVGPPVGSGPVEGIGAPFQRRQQLLSGGGGRVVPLLRSRYGMAGHVSSMGIFGTLRKLRILIFLD
jgi:hypothetical protein